MINKWNLKVAEFVSKEEESRYTCTAILVNPKYTVATNGRYLAWVSTPSAKVESFPVVEGAPEPQDNFGQFLMPVDAAKLIERALPKKSTIPVLLNAAIHTDQDDSGVHATVITTDLENPQVFRPEQVRGQFPAFERVVPKPEDAEFRIGVNAAYLAQVAKALADFTKGSSDAHPITISFYGSESAMRFDGTNGEQGMTVVLMPLRMNDDYFGTYGYEEREAAREAEREKERAKEREEAEAEANAEGEAEAVEQSADAIEK